MQTVEDNKLTLESHWSNEVDQVHGFSLEEEKLGNTPAHTIQEF